MRKLIFLVLLILLAGGCSTAPVGQQMAPAVDSDGDRVPDTVDRCPGTPSGVTVGTNGCGLDTDLDGVFDYLDRCAATPVGFPVDLKGCALDSDHDGVPDGRDQCPDTESAVRIDSFGCPPPKVDDRAQAEPATLELQVLFQSGKSVLGDNNDQEFQRGVEFIRNHPHSKVIVEGHTDSVGPARYNQLLAEKRAKVVRRALASRLGNRAPAMQVLGVGEADPVADNSSQEGRARNRRVVIRLASE